MINTKTLKPQLRAEKTTKNRDDFRVMITGIVFCILILMVESAFAKFHDAFLAERPFVKATVELFYVEDNLPPLILYDADANEAVHGTWIASIYLADGTRLSSRRGEGNYTNKEDDPKFWSWSAWFDNEQSDPPLVPDKPFYICVRYVVYTNDSGVDDSSPKFCSEVYDANNPINYIEYMLNEGVNI